MGCFASKHVAEPLVEQQQRGATPKDTDACQPQQQPEPVSVVCDGKGTIKVKSPFRDLAIRRPTGAAVVLLCVTGSGSGEARAKSAEQHASFCWAHLVTHYLHHKEEADGICSAQQLSHVRGLPGTTAVWGDWKQPRHNRLSGVVNPPGPALAYI